jgi:hypothetical protein
LTGYSNKLLLLAALLITGHQRKSAVKKRFAVPFGQLPIANCYLLSSVKFQI